MRNMLIFIRLSSNRSTAFQSLFDLRRGQRSGPHDLVATALFAHHADRGDLHTKRPRQQLLDRAVRLIFDAVTRARRLVDDIQAVPGLHALRPASPRYSADNELVKPNFLGGGAVGERWTSRGDPPAPSRTPESRIICAQILLSAGGLLPVGTLEQQVGVSTRATAGSTLRWDGSGLG